MHDLELLAIGRISVDLYAEQLGVSIRHVRSFRKSVGGTATNVAVAAARLGHRTAVFTKVGADPFGDYVRWALADTFGVDTRYLGTDPVLRTPLAFAELDPPDDPQIIFYREPKAPDLNLTVDDVDVDATLEVPILWVSAGALSAEPSRSTVHELLASRSRRAETIVDLDWRPQMWDAAASATREVSKALAHATLAIGNREECAIAVGTADPDEAAERLLALGLRGAIVKLGGDGVLVATSAGRREQVPPYPVRVVCGLGAGDAFGGAFCHGLLSSWDLADCARYGNAAGAIVAGRLMCADDMPTLDEIEGLLADPSFSPSERASSAPEARHKVSPASADARCSLTDDQWAVLVEQRATEPRLAGERLRARPRRPLLTDGRLFVVAADHTARGMLAVGDDRFAMADRRSLLDRLLVALENPDVDGVLGSADVLEELALLGALDGRLAFGTMNRGGIVGARWELDDRMTAYDAGSIAEAGLDGGKVLLRIADDDPATAATLEACAQAVSALAERHLPIMIEPLPYHVTSTGQAELLDDDDQLLRAVAVASGLGHASAYTWLKVPAGRDVARMLATTTLPALLLGGAPGPDPEATYATWESAMDVPNVRGLVVGRTLLYPPDGDVAAAVDRAARIVRPQGTGSRG